jgi:hypothetical protein
MPAGATARQIADAADLFPGDSATGRVGDFLLQNDRIRVIVQAPDRHIQPNPFGGAIVDASVEDAAGATQDHFGKVAPFFAFGRTLRAKKVEVVDGPGAAVVAATGPDDLDDYLNVKAILPLPLKLDPDAPLSLLVTSYYVLAQGESRVRIVTALCNQGAADLSLPVGDLLDSGGDLEFFNPMNQHGGFGYVGGLSGISDFPFYAYWGSTTAYAYVPERETGNHQVTVSGVTGTLLGTYLFDWIAGLPTPTGALRLPRGGRASYQRSLYVGRDLGEVTSAVYADRGATAQVSGRVTLGGLPVQGARVAIVKTETDPNINPHRHPVAVLPTGADGRYAGRVPAGSYEIAADYRALSRSAFAALDAAADAARDFDLAPLGRLRLDLHDPAQNPIPGKVLVYCESGPCVRRGGLAPAGGADDEGNFFRSSSYDPWPEGVQAWAFVGPDGTADIDLPGGGSYTVVASHGPTWSVEPATWPADRGVPFAVAAGATVALSLELARVVDTAGWIGGDFHVHGVNSPDSPIALLDRVRTFLADGVDLLVATDHDYVTDYAPTLPLLDPVPLPLGAKSASTWLATLVGEELTTFDYGHWNAFPLTRAGADLTGGAVDWGGSVDASLHPSQIHAALRANGANATPAETVVQANHPRGSLSWFTASRLDNASGETHACPQRFRLAPSPATAACDPAHGQAADTGLFSEDFTAMEIVNDLEEERIHGRMNDWMSFLSRGFLVTATAVSDTHHKFLVAAGYGRTWLPVATADPAQVAAAVNAGRAVASLGAFVTVTASNDRGETGTIGDVVATGNDGRVTLHVEVQTPSWLPPWQVELHSWHPDRVFRWDANGKGDDDYGNRTWPGYVCSPPSPSTCNGAKDAAGEASDFAAVGIQRSAVVAGDLVAGADPDSLAMRWLVARDFVVQPAQDNWYVVVVRRDPASAKAELTPGVPVGPALTILAVTNPVLVDADGNGQYDAPVGKVPRPTPWPGLAPGPRTWEEAVRLEVSRPVERCGR